MPDNILLILAVLAAAPLFALCVIAWHVGSEVGYIAREAVRDVAIRWRRWRS